MSIRAGQLKRNDLSGRDDAVLGESGRDSGVVGEDLEIRNLSQQFEEGDWRAEVEPWRSAASGGALSIGGRV